jgi:hypothetical protein
MIKKPSTISRGRLSVNCWDWPEADCVPSRKEEHYAVRLPNQNPNGLAGSEVRPQPPHCDKNSYILESPPFQCCEE